MSNEKPFDLNDQFAIAAMQALLAPVGEQHSLRICPDFIHGYEDTIDEVQAAKMERIASVAYHMAKAMRKARLSAFE